MANIINMARSVNAESIIFKDGTVLEKVCFLICQSNIIAVMPQGEPTPPDMYRLEDISVIKSASQEQPKEQRRSVMLF